jgi:hypothetical protein
MGTAIVLFLTGGCTATAACEEFHLIVGFALKRLAKRLGQTGEQLV